jgi:pimeloyl-ACP methyl ester carboxylesterase
MTTFGLVHGGFHGAWCWDRLVPELQSRGHATVAMDMPVDDSDAALTDFVDAVVDALAEVDEPVVLVGHSMAGLVIPHVAARRPVSRLVFLAAMFDNLPPGAGDDRLDEVPESVIDRAALSSDGRVTTISPEGAVAAFFHDCAPDDVEWALARLRPQNRAPATPLVEPWPDVPVSVIVCADDRSRNPEFSRRVAQRLGVEPIELPGSHSPFFARPAELAAVLVALAE